MSKYAVSIKEYLQANGFKMTGRDKGCACPSCEKSFKGKNMEEIWVLDRNAHILTIELRPIQQQFFISINSNFKSDDSKKDFASLITALNNIQKITRTGRLIQRYTSSDYSVIELSAIWENPNVPNEVRQLEMQNTRLASFVKESDAIKWSKENPTTIDIWR